jgi:hypothetical protein
LFVDAWLSLPLLLPAVVAVVPVRYRIILLRMLVHVVVHVDVALLLLSSSLLLPFCFVDRYSLGCGISVLLQFLIVSNVFFAGIRAPLCGRRQSTLTVTLSLQSPITLIVVIVVLLLMLL